MSTLIGKLLGVLILVISLTGGWFWQSVNHFTDNPVRFTEQAIDFEIKQGSSITSVSKQLESRGLIDSSNLFVWMIRLNNLPGSVQAGEYVIESGMSPKDMLLMFSKGKVKQYAFTIVEGWTFQQLLTAMHATPSLKHTLKEKSSEEIIQLLGMNGVHPEGYFLPDTYHFPAGTTDVEFLKRAKLALDETLSEAWNKRSKDLPITSPYEALILASIVEKETAVASERNKIAGVFSRRLKKKMRLQTDPTVIYGLGDSYNGNLQKKHLKDKSNPYNTYRIKGLPPTPIALPDKDAILAAVQPEKGEELYFVAKGDGSHYFSSTVEEHNKAVRQYQTKNRKADYRSTPNNVDKDS